MDNRYYINRFDFEYKLYYNYNTQITLTQGVKP